MAKIVSGETKYRGRFLCFRELVYEDDRGIIRKWESVDRAAAEERKEPASDAVFIIARIEPEGEMLLVRQFRPPAGAPVLEFPAGLIDPGETPETAAVRELYEETGYCGEVVTVLPPGYSTPGLTGESIVPVVMRVDGSKYPEIPANHQEECENIEVFRVKPSELAEFVREAVKSGTVVDSKIYTCLVFAGAW